MCIGVQALQAFLGIFQPYFAFFSFSFFCLNNIQCIGFGIQQFEYGFAVFQAFAADAFGLGFQFKAGIVYNV